MREGKQAENILNSLAQLAENVVKNNAPYFEQDKSHFAAAPPNRVFYRQKSVHHTLGGGTSADVLLWRNKKVSASVLTSATVIWILFEWLNYNFLTIVSFALILGMLGQFIWSNASGYLNRGSPSQSPRLVLPDELFVNIAISVGKEVNRVLGCLQDISCGGNAKQLVMVIISLLAASLVGTWCNFLTVIYIGFVAAHTLPVLYERYEVEFDSFISQALGQLQTNYRKLDASVLQRLPTRKLKGQKFQ